MLPKLNFFTARTIAQTAIRIIRSNHSHEATVGLNVVAKRFAPIAWHPIHPAITSNPRALTSLANQTTFFVKKTFDHKPFDTKKPLVPFVFLSLAVSSVSYMIYMVNQPREQNILHDPIDLSCKKSDNFIVSSANYFYVGKKIKGDLSGAIVQDKEGRRYLKKGAKNLNALVKEFLISEILAMIYPGLQPESLIMQEMKPTGKAQFYTLSRIYDNTMDLEAFIRQGDWKEKLAKKPLIGFEVALAADNAFAKQQDMKYANYIIQERDDGYYVASIDHEFAGAGFMSFANQTVFTTDIDNLTRGVRDLYDASEDNHAGLAGDPRAHEFMIEAKRFMKEEAIMTFYESLSQMDIKKADSFIENLEGTHGLISTDEGYKFFDEIEAVKLGASEVTEQSKVTLIMP